MSDDSSFTLETEENVEVGKVTVLKVGPTPTSNFHLPTSSHSLPASPPKTRKSKTPTSRPHRAPSPPIHEPVITASEPKYYQRFRSFLAVAEKKRKMRKDAMTLREEEACTFAPKLVAKQSVGKHKSMEQMYEDALKQAKDLQHRREVAIEHEIQSLGPFHPTINSQSLKLAEGKRDTDLFTFLHSTKTIDRPKRSESPAKPTFTPSINRRSEALFREKTVEDLLMEDAHKRLAKKSSQPAFSPHSEKLISSRSEKVLFEKFAGEYQTALKQVTDQPTLTKPQLYEVLRLLHFTKGLMNPHVEDLWESLSSDSQCGIDTRVLQSLLAAILRLSITDDGVLLSPQAVDRIHQSFKPLYETRQMAVAKSSKNRTFKFQVNYPFHPDTTKSGYFMLAQQTDRTALRSPKIEDYLREKKMKAADKGEKIMGQFRHAKKKSLFSQYLTVAQSTVKRPQDRNEALFRLAEVEQQHRGSLKVEDLAPRTNSRKGTSH